MGNPWVKRILGVVAGAIVAMIVVGLVEAAGHAIFPPPPGLDINNPEDQKRLMHVIPLGAKLAVIIAWFLGSLAGAWVAVRVSGAVMTAWSIAIVMIVLSVFTTQMFPHPLWMVVAALLLPLVAAWLAQRLSAKR